MSFLLSRNCYFLLLISYQTISSKKYYERKIMKKHWFIRNKWIIFTVSLVLCFGIYQLAIADHRSKLNVSMDDITIDAVSKEMFQDYISLMGTVEPIRTIYLDATFG